MITLLSFVIGTLLNFPYPSHDLDSLYSAVLLPKLLSLLLGVSWTLLTVSFFISLSSNHIKKTKRERDLKLVCVEISWVCHGNVVRVCDYV